jgi:hypothetical protein
MNQVDKLRGVARNNGWEFVGDYSGRFMYKKKCVGIVGPSAEAIVEAATLEGVTGATRDSMGFDVIVYWPDIAAEEVTDETN